MYWVKEGNSTNCKQKTVVGLRYITQETFQTSCTHTYPHIILLITGK